MRPNQRSYSACKIQDNRMIIQIPMTSMHNWTALLYLKLGTADFVSLNEVTFIRSRVLINKVISTGIIRPTFETYVII